jgi:hypothetical protein
MQELWPENGCLTPKNRAKLVVMQPARVVVLLFWVLNLARPAHASDSFEAEHQRAIAVNPRGVHLRISLDQGQSSFHIGDTIRLQYLFTADSADQYVTGARAEDRGGRSALETFVLDRPQDAVDPMGGYWDLYQAIYCRNSMRWRHAGKKLGPASPQHDSVEVTHYLRFTTPGTYRLYVVTNQVELVKPPPRTHPKDTFDYKVDDPSLYTQSSQSGGPSLASENTVSFQVLSQEETSAAHEVEAIAAKANQGNRSWLYPADAFRLFEIGTPAARQAASQTYIRYSGDVNEILLATMIAAPDRGQAIALLKARLRNPGLPLQDDDLVHDLALLELLEQNPALTADEIRHGGLENGNHWRKILVVNLLADFRAALATLDQRLPATRAMTIKTLHLMSDRVCSLPLPLTDPERQQLESLHLASLPDLPESEQNSDLLNFRWACAIPEEQVLPVLQEIYEHPSENSSSTRETVLKEITKLDPALGRTLFRHQMLTGDVDVRPYRVSYLNLSPGLDLDGDLIGMLEGRKTEEMERAAPIIGLYATNSILPRVKKVYEIHGPDWPCHVEAGLLVYFLRVDSAYGQVKLDPALEASYRKADGTIRGEGSGCTEDTLLVDMALSYRTADWKPWATAALNDPRPIVAAGGARVMGMGDVALTPGKPLVTRLRKLRKEWDDFDIRKNDREYIQHWRSGSSELESMILTQLVNASDSPEHLVAWKEAHDVCITDECRVRLNERIERYRVPPAKASSPAAPLRHKLKH